jgi:hypothetical protein
LYLVEAGFKDIGRFKFRISSIEVFSEVEELKQVMDESFINVAFNLVNKLLNFRNGF